MAGEAFQQLLDLGSVSGKTAIPGVGLNADIQQAQDTEENFQASQSVRKHEDAINAQVNADIAARKAAVAQYGTSDPSKIAAIKATGAFGGDLSKMMEIDPVGTAAKVQRAIDLSGHGGMQDLPQDWHPPEVLTGGRQFSRGTGQGGEPYFTNLSPEELQQEHDASEVAKGRNPKLDAAEPVSNLTPFTPGRTGGVESGSEGPEAAGYKPQSPEELLFQGKIDQAQAIAGKPERTEAKEKAVQTYLSDLFDNNPDIRSMRNQMEKDFMSGDAKAKGLDMKDMRVVDTVLAKRGKTPGELTHPGIDKMFYKPWVAPGAKPGQAADIAEPASLLNPGGGTSTQTQLNQDQMMAKQKAGQGIDATIPTEQTTAYQYAKGKVAKQAGRSQVETGGSGEPGMKGTLHDMSDFLEGKGRAGYGESGPVGMAKDVAAFYGPRMPGDILAAVSGAGAGGAIGKGIQGAKKLRAVENMFGLF